MSKTDRTARPRAGQRWRRLGALGALGAALALTPVLPTAAQTSPPGVAQRTAAPYVTAQQLTGSPESYAGQQVTTSGDLAQILGQRAFVVVDDNVLSRARLLIVSASPLRDDLGQLAEANVVLPDNVRATGTVRSFDLAAIEQQVGAELDDAALAPYAGQPVVVAESIVNIPYPVVPGERWPDSAEASVDQITDRPSDFFGQAVAVSGEFESAVGPRAFVVEDGDLLFDEQMVVVATQPLLDRDGNVVAPDQVLSGVVRLHGTVQPFQLGQIEAQANVDLDDAAFAEFEGQPVLVADAVVPLATTPNRPG